jgi:tRNA (cmo5U34)-methyltransferase
MKIQELFDRGAASYDLHRQKVIPCFDDFYNTLVELIPFEKNEEFTFLDLGAGTGLVTAFILEFFPNAQARLVDLSEQMLQKAEKRFQRDDRVKGYHTMDYAVQLPEGKYELVVSAMSVHHLTHGKKKQLFKLIHTHLLPGGSFIHADLILGDTPKMEAIFQDKWVKHIRGTGIKGDTLKQILERMAQDQPSKLKDQLTWMTAAGFHEVNASFEYDNFAVYAGVKQA